MEAFRAKYRIPQGAVLEYCPPERVLTDREVDQVDLDLKKKRLVESLEEGKVAPRQGKQQKTTREQKDKRAPSAECQEETERVEVRVNPRTWSPKLEVDKVAIPYIASVREYNRGRAGYIVETLEQPMLLPRDMEAYRRFSQPELFLSLKRDLAMITQQVFVAEEDCRNNRKLADVKALSRAEVEKALGTLKQEQFELSEKLKEAEKNRRNTEASLKNTESQAKDQRQKLYVTEINLATEKQTVLDLKATFQKAKEEARLAKEEAQLVKEVAEAEKKAFYQLGVEETEARLSEELPKALRLPEKVFFPPEIREIPNDATEASKQATVVPDAIPLVNTAGGSGQVAVQAEDVEVEKNKGKGKGKRTSSKAKDPAKESVTKDLGADSQARDVPPPQPKQKENPLAEA
ncbi:protein WEAK CHLOROPLAST MOVEMENT UNDER BLUE LIGHT 1-like [Quercus lobata]|uniref:protein WEAK CHLOROPLAST MOVEMENT UNDER BLUE LIGHT 1-like n=1 Tax=Quercus lobata TaxID=97700 RepID=UPI00124461A3|nr:protein WEAK CHLOROPLAST MOVEMENT UNDER BLUE LIGHT 1-like [Quercus lobata]